VAKFVAKWHEKSREVFKMTLAAGNPAQTAPKQQKRLAFLQVLWS
jgi:hypothetical protein